jgi:GNAT superfamily N-acetyltransferase
MQIEKAQAMAAALMGRVGEIRAARKTPIPPYQHILNAADAHVPAVQKHFQTAFNKAAKSLGVLPEDQVSLETHMSVIMETLETDLSNGLDTLLFDTLVAGGDAAATNLVRSPFMRTSAGHYKPTLVALQAHLATLVGTDTSGNYGHAGRPGKVGGSAPSTQSGIKNNLSEDFQETVFRDYDPNAVSDGMLLSVDGLEGEWRDYYDYDLGTETAQLVANRKTDGFHISRTFYREEGELIVSHNRFAIPEDEQGQGIARKILSDSVDTYEQIGVSKIYTDANIDIGGYAWAKFGFKARDPEDLARTLLDKIRMDWQDDYLEDHIAHMTDLINRYRDDSSLPWHVAGARLPNGDQVGKDLMMGTAWQAVLDLGDQESMVRFNRYVGR